MRVAAIADIHSNLPALEAVLEAVDAGGIEEVWCLGDVVGYGADPDACADLVRERCAVCLVGNHDLAVLGELRVSAFSEAAAAAVAWTQENIASRTLEFLAELEPAAQREDIALFHASPRDPVWEYVLSVEQAEACFEVQQERIGLIGHSHVAALLHPARRRRGPARSAARRRATGRCSTSPSGAGCSTPAASASRATATRAPPGWSSTPRRRRPASTASPTTSTGAAAAISAAGLPSRLADRLQVGL